MELLIEKRKYLLDCKFINERMLFYFDITEK